MTKFQPIGDMYYHIVSKKSGMVLDVSGGSTEKGAKIIQWPCHGGSNQLFKIEAKNDGYYQFKSQKSGMVLDVSGGSTEKGAKIIQWPSHGGSNQLFKIEEKGDGYYQLKSKKSGMVLDVSGGSTGKGAEIIQWPSHGGSNQLFKISPMYLSAAEVKDIIRHELRGKLKSDCDIYLADSIYYVTPLSDAKRIIHQSYLDTYRWTSQRFDCDDFALVLKAKFAEDAYRNGNRRAAHCFGIVWGSLPGPHAINWMINEDLRLRFIEPQNDEIYYPTSDDRDIYLMLS